MPENTSPDTIPAVTAEIAVTKIKQELQTAGLNFQKLLDEASKITFSKETLEQDYAPLKQLREVVAKIKAVTNPYTAGWKAYNEAKGSLEELAGAILNEKTNEYKRLNEEIRVENDRQTAETARINGIKQQIDNLLMSYSQKAAEALTDTEIVDIEKAMGAESRRQNIYMEFLDEFKARMEPIKQLLAAKKGKVRELKEVDKRAENASDEQLEDILEKREQLNSLIQETGTRILEESINQATQPSFQTYVGTSSFKAVKPRRTTWEMELVDVPTALKKDRDLVIVGLNREYAKGILQTLKATKVLDGKTEYTLNGVRYYQKETY
jgi:chromosome segregation ATPase